MSSGELPGLQNRRAASLMSPVRSTRTRFRHSDSHHSGDYDFSTLSPEGRRDRAQPEQDGLLPLELQAKTGGRPLAGIGLDPEDVRVF